MMKLILDGKEWRVNDCLSGCLHKSKVVHERGKRNQTQMASYIYFSGKGQTVANCDSINWYDQSVRVIIGTSNNWYEQLVVPVWTVHTWGLLLLVAIIPHLCQPIAEVPHLCWSNGNNASVAILGSWHFPWGLLPVWFLYLLCGWDCFLFASCRYDDIIIACLPSTCSNSA